MGLRPALLQNYGSVLWFKWVVSDINEVSYAFARSSRDVKAFAGETNEPNLTDVRFCFCVLFFFSPSDDDHRSHSNGPNETVTHWLSCSQGEARLERLPLSAHVS